MRRKICYETGNASSTRRALRRRSESRRVMCVFIIDAVSSRCNWEQDADQHDDERVRRKLPAVVAVAVAAAYSLRSGTGTSMSDTETSHGEREQPWASRGCSDGEMQQEIADQVGCVVRHRFVVAIVIAFQECRDVERPCDNLALLTHSPVHIGFGLHNANRGA
ncbi:hypothetical protein J6590_078499 [Homalodisca vitripennis]|nr:hypothetical protein J6590_041733 [Homalodisca vitripennis]KAG8309704.1 hypothetical protein J6590_078499 [Homalodisca vitripennis]